MLMGRSYLHAQLWLRQPHAWPVRLRGVPGHFLWWHYLTFSLSHPRSASAFQYWRHAHAPYAQNAVGAHVFPIAATLPEIHSLRFLEHVAPVESAVPPTDLRFESICTEQRPQGSKPAYPTLEIALPCPISSSHANALNHIDVPSDKRHRLSFLLGP